MPRIKSAYKRKSKERNPDIYVISCEGAEAEVNYFEGIRDSLDFPSKLDIHIAKRDESNSGNSSPLHVLDCLEKYISQKGLKKNDLKAIVIDADRWTPEQLSQIAQNCENKGICFAFSNPCFELWILTHFIDLDRLSDTTKNKIRINKRVSNNLTYLKRKVGDFMGGHKINNDTLKTLIPLTKKAISNNQALDINPNERWPNDICSRIYLILNRILN